MDSAAIGQANPNNMENITPAIYEAVEQKKAQSSVKRMSSAATKKDVLPTESREENETGKEAITAKQRKRTKSGCLTCRKRRIKCGEERPICGNCVKSKRNCEGYTPRVIFKDPLHTYRPHVGATNSNSGQYQSMSSQSISGAQFARIPPGSTNQAVLAPLAPRPSPPISQHGAPVEQSLGFQGLPADQYALFGYTFNGQTFADNDLPPRMRQGLTQQTNPYEKSRLGSQVRSVPHEGPQAQPHPKLQYVSTGDSDSGIDMGYPGSTSEVSHSSTSSAGPPMALTQHDPSSAETTHSTNIPAPPRRVDSLPQALFPPQADQQFSDCWINTTPDGYQNSQWESFGPHADQQQHGFEAYGVHASSTSPTVWHSGHGAPQGINGHTGSDVQDNYGTYTGYPATGHGIGELSQPLNVQQSTVLDEPEDDYWDVSSDEETAVSNNYGSQAPPVDLGLMIAISANQHGKSFRSLTNFLNEPNILYSYRPTYAASPLRDPQTALIFCHFITATAPTISSSERRTINSEAMFSGLPVPKSHQALWTYTMPMLALHHQGLLHAMLALASLHIAKLQKASPTPSLKHYHFALRKVAKSLGNPSKRNNIATLGATLLLGFYEVTTAEHNKWNSHLAGAKQLILDIDFAGMVKRIKAHKLQAKADRQKTLFNPYSNHFTHPFSQQYNYDDHADDSEELDENLVSVVMGWQTRYNQYGHVVDGSESSAASSAKPLTQIEIDDYETECDLFWWYAKQDMYQSIVSGNRLLLPYERWSHIPPRAAVGRLDATHGTMDHLLLLMARIADFAGKDLPRKKEVYIKGSKQPVKTGYSFEGSNPPIPTSGVTSNNYPVPPGGQYTAIPMNNHPAPQTDLQTSTMTAEAEWLDITRALDTFEEALGPSFAALSPEHMPPLSTPFGPALYYRTYSIACIWSLYYTGRIIATRVHPSMPPAAMAAAGIAALRTAGWANTIGRINAGIQPLNSSVPLNPLHGAALMDATMGLFHAGVQFRDAAQRGWTITKLRDVARLTGWQTSALIASGCERAWMRMHEEGKGPPYERTMNTMAKDDRVAGRSRDPDQGPPKDNNDRRFIHVNPGTRVYWAMGILSVDEDMRAMSLGV